MKNQILRILTLLILTNLLVFAQLTVKDQDVTPHTLFQVNDEGTAGSIYFPFLTTHPGDTDQKLYNYSGKLIWDGQELGSAYSAGGWTNLSGNIYTTTLTNKVGIGTSSPSAALQVTGNDGVLFTGTFGSGIIPEEGAGARMMWYPKKAAFRVGFLDEYAPNFWDDDSIGNYSMAMGFGVKAKAQYSTAMGDRSEAIGDFSTAMGFYTRATGDYSTSIGMTSEANGISSTAMGSYTEANGNFSTAMGYGTKANSNHAVAIGIYNIGGGSPSGWVETDPLFEIGNSINETQPANALTVLKNGNVGIGIHNPTYKLDIKGGNILVRGDDGYTASGHEGIVYLGSVHSYIKAEYGYGVKIGAYAAADAISIKELSGNVGIGTTSPGSKLSIVGLSEYSNNAAAISAGLSIGDLYRTGDLLKIVH